MRQEVIDARQTVAMAIEESKKTRSELDGVKEMLRQLMADKSARASNSVSHANFDYDPRLDGEPLDDVAVSPPPRQHFCR